MNKSLKTSAFKASAPASLMLLGEYGVLHGEPALVCAIDKRISVLLTPEPKEHIVIHAARGEYHTTLAQLQIEAPYQFVLAALKQYQQKMKTGCRLEIIAHFSDQVGLGSSAAVTVATLAVLAAWLNVRMAPLDLLRQARQVVRTVQRVGSGADVAAAVYGGIVAYRQQPLQAEKFTDLHPLTLYYAGYKTPTPRVIQKVQARFEAYPKLYRQLMRSIGQCAEEGIVALRKKDWQKFGAIMTMQQGLLQSLGVCDVTLASILKALSAEPTLLGAKISGSGLGDCVVGLGRVHLMQPFHDAAIVPIDVSMTKEGVRGEKI